MSNSISRKLKRRLRTDNVAIRPLTRTMPLGLQVTVLAALSAGGTLATNILLPSLPGIAMAVGVSSAQETSAITVFLAMFAVGQLIVGPVSTSVTCRVGSFAYTKLCLPPWAARPLPPSADIGPGGQSVGQAARFCLAASGNVFQNWSATRLELSLNFGDGRAGQGRIDGENRMRSGSVASASRSRTRGWRTATGPYRSSPRVPAGDRGARRAGGRPLSSNRHACQESPRPRPISARR